MDYKKLYENSRYELYGNENDSVFLRAKKREYVSVIALQDNRLVVVQQERIAMQEVTYELPGGKIEEGETIEQAARRELREETGLICVDMQYVGYINSYACMINVKNHFYFTSDLQTQAGQDLDEDEDIQVLRVPLQEVYEKVKNGEWLDSEMLAALMKAQVLGLL